jgi:hypothetical protein
VMKAAGGIENQMCLPSVASMFRAIASADRRSHLDGRSAASEWLCRRQQASVIAAVYESVATRANSIWRLRLVLVTGLQERLAGSGGTDHHQRRT